MSNVLSGGRQTKRTTGTRNSRTAISGESRAGVRSQAERKTPAKPFSQTSSRPQTPIIPPNVRPTTPATLKSARTKDVLPPTPPPRHPGSPQVDSDSGSGPPDAVSNSPAMRPESAQSGQSSVPSAPPGIPPPPGLSAPPGLSLPSRVPQLAPDPPYMQPSYQMSSQAQALVDDLRARREALIKSSTISPFPDFDRTLQTLSGGFSFNLDPKLVGGDVDSQMEFPDLDTEAAVPFTGGFMDAFPALRPSGPSSGSFTIPPGLSYPHNPSRSIFDPLATRVPPLERQTSVNSNYIGSFNPFDAKEETPQRQYSPLEDDMTRKVSRFGFARGRQDSASSPVPTPSSLTNNSENVSHASYYNSPDLATNVQSQQQWGFQRRQQPDFSHTQSVSLINSPVIPQAQSQGHSPYLHQSTSFQPFDSSVSEAQLRELIQSSHEHANSSRSFSGRRLLFV
jgi:CCR4-NOT transcription complex subunit 4